MSQITMRNGQAIPVHFKEEGGDEPTIIVPKRGIKVWTNAKGDLQWEISAKADHTGEVIAAVRQMIRDLETELENYRK